MNQIKFEQGNQARLDITRQALYAMYQSIIITRGHYIDGLQEKERRLERAYLTQDEVNDLRSDIKGYKESVEVYNSLILKVQAAVDLYHRR